MENITVKKIYEQREALVSDDVINSSDAEITAAILDATPGMIIYNAGMSIKKQLSLDGRWVSILSGSTSGNDGKDGVTFTPKVSEDGTLSWTNDGGLDNPSPVKIKGEKGDRGETGAAGKDGSDGEPGKNGVGVKSISLKTDADGNVVSGTVTFTDLSTTDIEITSEVV